MINPKLNNIYLCKDEYILYARQFKLQNCGIEGQKRLKESKILIIGAGGLGCPAMLYLVIAGTGCIGILDNDYIDMSNLNRQILYNMSTINTNKILSAKLHLNQINPYCKIILHKYKLNTKNALEIIQYYDIIIDATDNFNTRYIIDTICFKLHKIHIYGAINKFDSQMSVFNYKNYIRYSNIYNKNIINFNNNNCYNNGILGITTGYIGILQATETIKIILGVGNIMYKKLLICNLINLSIKTIKLYIIPGKKIQKFTIKSNKYKTPFISTKQIKSLQINYIILDIREKQEFQQQHIRYAINIPLNKFRSQKTIEIIKNYNQIYVIILFCQNTYRSIVISKILNKYNIKHFIIQENILYQKIF
uniref:Molybdopterin biosynthesis protein n=1 Tax=Dipterocladia arabiensis TaxID=2007176 RepID=A0A1Z1M130_9FLOR|nr:Molybdopterin biosynthesis protein [Dipterocladia arabiensis]ARW59464.1 Molybdopterin biosynthesis protein [Dipterocladia arabiensis]